MSNNPSSKLLFKENLESFFSFFRIGDLELFQERQPTTLSASCVYASTVSVSSNAFNLTFADASHNLVGVGDFRKQFSMSISDKDGETDGEILIGEQVWIDIEWEKELNYLGFYPTDCYVALGDDDEQQHAEIIKDGRFSSTLGVVKTGPYGERLHERKTGFTFKSFSGSSDLTSRNVKITCDLKVCFFGDEECYEKSTCPSEPDGYEYTEFGCSEVNQRPDNNGACFEDFCLAGETGSCTSPLISRTCSEITDPCAGKKNCQTFVNSCAINPTQNNKVGIVEKPHVHFKISADVQCTNLHKKDEWFSIFHVTTGEDRGSFGSRIFAMWKRFGKTSTYHVPVSHHSDGQPYFERVYVSLQFQFTT